MHEVLLIGVAVFDEAEAFVIIEEFYCSLIHIVVHYNITTNKVQESFNKTIFKPKISGLSGFKEVKGTFNFALLFTLVES
ncbi:hypothetical protein GCM10027189_19640 [Rufibacter soli]